MYNQYWLMIYVDLHWFTLILLTSRNCLLFIFFPSLVKSVYQLPRCTHHFPPKKIPWQFNIAMENICLTIYVIFYPWKRVIFHRYRARSAAHLRDLRRAGSGESAAAGPASGTAGGAAGARGSTWSRHGQPEASGKLKNPIPRSY